MAKKKLPPAMIPTQWKKGQSGNPEGARKHDPVKRALRNLSLETFREVIEAACAGNVEYLRELVLNPKSSALQVGVAKAMANAIEAGDYPTIRTIIEDIIGKVPETVNVVSKNVNQNMNANVNATVDENVMKAVLKKLEGEI